MKATTMQAIRMGRAMLAVLGFGGVAAIAGCATNTASDNSAPAVRATAAPVSPAGHGHAAHAGHGGGMSHAMGTTGPEALKRLQGRDFDIAFLSQMIAHHEAAVTMAKQALKTAEDARTKAEAQKVVTAQTGEIKQMTGWLKEWYDAGPSADQQALVRKDMAEMMAMPVTSDQMFYERMIPHHQGAIDMSALAPERSQRAEVKALAARIIRDQRAEIAAYHRALGHGAPAPAQP